MSDCTAARSIIQPTHTVRARGDPQGLPFAAPEVVTPGPFFITGWNNSRRSRKPAVVPLLEVSIDVAEASNTLYCRAHSLLDRILEAQVAFLQKPFTPVPLAAKVREVLDVPAARTA